MKLEFPQRLEVGEELARRTVSHCDGLFLKVEDPNSNKQRKRGGRCGSEFLNGCPQNSVFQ